MKRIFKITFTVLLAGGVVWIFFATPIASDIRLWAGEHSIWGENSARRPDPSLSYEAVAGNISKYRGSRVRWYGTYAGGESRNRIIGSGSVLNGTFVDPTTDFTVTIRSFAVEMTSPKDSVDFMFSILDKPCWVTGTVAGTGKGKMVVGSNEVSPVQKEIEVPLLRSVLLECPTGDEAQR